ncbi:hypothetical protein H2203_004776 [Taxawa tesnikishii (nom. ined.)]|nr:hypothetical protein H2203_004776 [Dothideales sp. JES 119]
MYSFNLIISFTFILVVLVNAAAINPQACGNENDILASDVLVAAPNGRIAAWVDQPNIRGTLDIIWTCLATIFISTYTILCLNVPSRHDGWKNIFGRQLKWMCLAILGPEIVMTYAAGQWSRAHQSVEAFHEAGYQQWTLRLAFFADMGGFVLCPSQSESFPLNAKHVYWLVVNGHIEYREVTAADIWDKSKQDTFTKAITGFQMGYLVVQCIGRVSQGLAITTLELNTLAIVVCSLMTSYAWLHKPAGVRTPIKIHTKNTIAKITGLRTWRNTPLDFVDENGPGWAINIQPFMKMPVIPAERPIQRIPNDRFPMNPYGYQEYLLCFATLLFAAIHVSGWNLAFPSRNEQLLWRIASMLLFCITAAFWILETMASWKRLGRWRYLYKAFGRQRPPQENHKPTTESVETTPKVLPLPWEFWSIFPLALMYGVARLYLIIEAFLELRNLEATAFVNVQWSNFIPHF